MRVTQTRNKTSTPPALERSPTAGHTPFLQYPRVHRSTTGVAVLCPKHTQPVPPSPSLPPPPVMTLTLFPTRETRRLAPPLPYFSLSFTKRGPIHSPSGSVQFLGPSSFDFTNPESAESTEHRERTESEQTKAARAAKDEQSPRRLARGGAARRFAAWGLA
ncbi:hypothetical protein VDGL01_03778 [Verticillium dahliae]